MYEFILPGNAYDASLTWDSIDRMRIGNVKQGKVVAVASYSAAHS
jgi:hypothetical protein